MRPPDYGQPPLHDDPDHVRAAAWLQRGAGEPRVRILGVPFSALSISGARCDLLPSALRHSLWSFSTWLPSHGVELPAVTDLGDLALDGLQPEPALVRVRDVCASLRDGPPLALVGGDNSITAPATLGLGCASLLTIDAHHDVRTGLSNGSPVRVLLDSGVRDVRQLGIADLANSAAYTRYATERGVRWTTVAQVRREGMVPLVRRALGELPAPVYVDVDVDAVDRALAPGAPAALPGGLQPSDLMDAAFVCGAHPAVAALDVVEVDPERDVAGVTVRLAASALLHFLAGVGTR